MSTGPGFLLKASSHIKATTICFVAALRRLSIAGNETQRQTQQQIVGWAKHYS